MLEDLDIEQSLRIVRLVLFFDIFWRKDPKLSFHNLALLKALLEKALLQQITCLYRKRLSLLTGEI